MNIIDKTFHERSRQVFLSGRPESLAVLPSRIEQDETVGTIQRRDLLSALNRVEVLFDVGLEKVPATPRSIRELFDKANPVALGVSAKTLRNIRSGVNRALKLYGCRPLPVTKRIPLSPSWEDLLAPITVPAQRHALLRLACFCSALQIAPDKVTPDTLIGLFDALVEEELVKSPKGVIKNTIANWNRCGRRIKGWPAVTLKSPFKKAPWTLPLDGFPQSFQNDIADWQKSVTDIDPLALDGPAAPLSQPTIDQRIREFRMFASALVHRGALRPDEITGLDVLMTPEWFKECLRYFLERQDNRRTVRLHNFANSMRHVARHYVRVDEGTHAVLEQMCRKLRPNEPRGMTDKNRERLRPFEIESNVRNLLRLPDVLAKEARAMLARNPLKAARLMERAVIFGIETHFALRPRTLRGLHLERNFIWDRTRSPARCLLVLSPQDIKTKTHLEFELPADVAVLLDEHVERFRPHLPGSDSGWLFPGQNGRHRSKNTISEAIRSTAAKYLGLEINPHLFRHALAKIVIERAPELEASIRRVLGHSTLETTYAHYLGTEGKGAGRHLDRLLDRVLIDPKEDGSWSV